MNKKRTYPTWDLWTLTPDRYEDLHFTVEASVSCSDERDVGLSACEVTVDIDTSTVWVEPVEGYDTEKLKEYVIDLLESDKASDFEQEIYEQAYEEKENAYYDRCEYKAERLRDEGRGND